MCLPNLELPTLPSLGPFSIEPPSLPAFSGNLDLCCKTLPFSTPTLPPILGPLVFNGAVATAVNTAIATVNAYLRALPPKCPLE
jgi:hypothetical protein